MSTQNTSYCSHIHPFTLTNTHIRTVYTHMHNVRQHGCKWLAHGTLQYAGIEPITSRLLYTSSHSPPQLDQIKVLTFSTKVSSVWNGWGPPQFCTFPLPFSGQNRPLISDYLWLGQKLAEVAQHAHQRTDWSIEVMSLSCVPSSGSH